MKNNNLKGSSLIIGFGISLCMVFVLSTANAGETVLHGKAVMKWQRVALQDSDEENLKKRLGVHSLIGADLSGKDLRWTYLKGTNLSQAKLQGANLAGSNLKNANLQGADLRGTNLSRASLEATDLRGADLTGVENLILRQIAAAIYDKETKFPEGITFDSIPKYNKDRLKSALGVKMLEGVNAQGMILRWGDFKGVDMQWSSLQKADFTGADLSEANFSAANMRGANLVNANLQKASLKNASLQGANLVQVNLQGADMTGISLQGANLSGADLKETKLLSANLTSANLSGTDLSSADLRGADLREVKNITVQQLQQAIVDRRTRLPEGITFKQIE
ncbi:MAG: pentapeptide repeat-containing protein [Candidatus Brocadiaceae bacterium]|nr:pentapeptide repeat-containing protein [Candidatus Brocadiaceae bacterium]